MVGEHWNWNSVYRRTGMANGHWPLATHETKMEKGVLRWQLSVVNIFSSMAYMLDRCGDGDRLRNRGQEWRLREEREMH